MNNENEKKSLEDTMMTSDNENSQLADTMMTGSGDQDMVDTMAAPISPNQDMVDTLVTPSSNNSKDSQLADTMMTGSDDQDMVDTMAAPISPNQDMVETLMTPSSSSEQLAETAVNSTSGQDIVETLVTPQSNPLENTVQTQIQPTVLSADKQEQMSGTVLSKDSGTLSGTILTNGALSQTGTINTALTRTNSKLKIDDQRLDSKLQLSRGSVFVSMLEQKGPALLPAAVRNKLETQETVGKYLINKPLAAGGMGAVLDITDNDFQRHSAMKVIHAQFANQPEALERFLEEAQVTAQLEHPNIVPIHDIGVMEDGTLYYTMKMIRGESFGEVVKGLQKEKPEYIKKWTYENILLSFLKILDGMSYAHEKGVVHRDMKPDNVMIETHGEVLVVDWGIAKVLDMNKDENVPSLEDAVNSLRDEECLSATQTGAAMGTPFYMPKEQALGEKGKIDARSDIYALGATLYELIARKRHIKAKSITELLSVLMSGEYTPVDEVRDDIHPDLAAIIHKSLSMEPEDRYQTCKEFSEDITSYISGQAVAARQRNLIERFGNFVQKHKAKVIAATLMVVVLAAGAYGMHYVQQQELKEKQAELLRESQEKFDLVKDKFDNEKILLQKPKELSVDKLSEHVDALSEIKTDIAEIKGYNKSQVGLPELAENSSVLLSQVQSILDDKKAEKSNLIKAKELYEEGIALMNSGDFEKAEQKLNSALELNPSNKNISEALKSVIAKLADKALAEQTLAAKENKDKGDVFLVKAEKKMPDSLSADTVMKLGGDTPNWYKAAKSTSDNLSKASEFYTKAQINGISPIGLNNSIQKVGKMIEELEQKQVSAKLLSNGYRSCLENIKQAKDFFIKDKLPSAIESCTVAITHFPKGEKARELKDKYTKLLLKKELLEKQKAEAEALNKDAIEKATVAMKNAESSYEKWTKNNSMIKTESEKIIKLKEKLAGVRLAKKDTLWNAHKNKRKYEANAVNAWSEANASASIVLNSLASMPDHELVSKANKLLAKMSFAKLQDAKERQSNSEIAIFENMLESYDKDGHYKKMGEITSQLIVEGVNSYEIANIVIGDYETLSLGNRKRYDVASVDLTRGNYAVIADGYTLPFKMTHKTNRKIVIPKVKKQTLSAGKGADVSFNYFPREDGSKGLMMSTCEISNIAWAYFVHDKENMKTINQHLKANKPLSTAPFYPKDTNNNKESNRWEAKLKHDVGGNVTSVVKFIVPTKLLKRPVTGITKVDVEQFCKWFSKKTGKKVRLPTAEEWQFASTANDDRRIYTWGSVFDEAFTTGDFLNLDFPNECGIIPTDKGPFGHFDLSGNVREWVVMSDGKSAVAGGSWEDNKEKFFETSSVEEQNEKVLHHAIGFRVVLEE